jgi:PhnB protein
MPSKRRKPATRASRKKTELPAAKPSHVNSGLAPAMQAVNTYLAVANVNASIGFLERVFGFTRGVVLPGADGQPRYAEMRHGDSVVMLIPKGDATSASGGAAALYTYVSDVDKALTKARAAGAGVSEAEDRPWGDRTGTVTDPDGYRWVLATFKKLVPFSE